MFAGALIEELLKSDKVNLQINCDSAFASIDLWSLAKIDLIGYIQKCSHRYRLKKLGLDNVMEYCFTLNTTNVLPVLEKGRLVLI